jgi:hypothetical protein
VLNRPGVDVRRDRVLEDHPTRDGFDRDDIVPPPAIANATWRPPLERSAASAVNRGIADRGFILARVL